MGDDPSDFEFALPALPIAVFPVAARRGKRVPVLRRSTSRIPTY